MVPDNLHPITDSISKNISSFSFCKIYYTEIVIPRSLDIFSFFGIYSIFEITTQRFTTEVHDPSVQWNKPVPVKDYDLLKEML